MQAVAAADCPARDHGNDDLWHEADEPLDLENVQSAKTRRIDLAGSIGLVFVAVLSSDPLIPTGAERPSAVLRGRAVAGEKHAAHIRCLARVVQDPIELVDRCRSKGVADLRPVERNADGALVLRPVVGEVLQVEARYFVPLGGIEDLGNHTLLTP